MLDGLSVVCSRETAVTRAEAESEKTPTLNGGGIEAVVVSAKREVNHFKYERPDTDPVKPTEEGRGPSGGGGGGGGAPFNPGGLGNTRYQQNKNIMLASDSREKLEPLLDSLRRDCMAGKIIGSIRGNVTIRTGFIGNSVMIPTAYTFEGGTVWTTSRSRWDRSSMISPCSKNFSIRTNVRAKPSKNTGVCGSTMRSRPNCAGICIEKRLGI